jgi:hypothetical protein
MNGPIDWNHIITQFIDKDQDKGHSARNLKEAFLTSVAHERAHTTSRSCEKVQAVTILGHGDLVRAAVGILQRQMGWLERIERADVTPRHQAHVWHEIKPLLSLRALFITIDLVVPWGHPLCLSVPRREELTGSCHLIYRLTALLVDFPPGILNYCLHWMFLGHLILPFLDLHNLLLYRTLRCRR